MPQSAAWAQHTPLNDGSAAIAAGAAVAADPFGEHRPRRLGVRRQILGALFHFHSDSQALLALVDAAYAGLPAHRLPGAPEFHVTLTCCRVRRAAPMPSRRLCARTPAAACCAASWMRAIT